MPGLNNFTTITIDNLTQIANLTSGDPTEFLINVSNIIFNGWLWFIVLCVVWVIIFMAFEEDSKSFGKQQSIVNFMYAGAMCSIASFILRAIYVIKDGIAVGMLSDFQMWLFPLVTIGCAVIAWNTKSAYSN